MAERSAPGVDGPQAWLVAAVSTLMMSIALGAIPLLVVTLKPIALDFGWPRAVPSLAYGLTFLGMGVGGVLLGRWSDRAGMGPPAFLGSVMLGAGTALASRTESPWQLYVTFGLMVGLLGGAAFFGPLIANTTRWFQRRRGMAVAIVTGGQSLAGAFWPPIFRYLNDAVGWRQTYFWFGVFVLATLPPLSLALRGRPPRVVETSAAEGGDMPVRVAGVSPRVAQGTLCLAIVGCCTAMSVPLGHIVAHASDLGYSAARGAELLAVVLAVSFVSRLGLGILSDRSGGLRALAIGSSLQTMALGLFAGLTSLPALYATAVLFGLGFGGIIPAYAVIVRELFPAREAGWRIALVYLFGAIGMAQGGWLAGVIFDVVGAYQPAFLLGLSFNILNLAIVAGLIRRVARYGRQTSQADRPSPARPSVSRGMSSTKLQGR